MKNVIGILIVLAVIIGFFFYFTGSNTTEESLMEQIDKETEEESQLQNEKGEEAEISESDIESEDIKIEEVAEIIYMDEGFKPSAIQINKGEKVRFVNQSSGNMWVGSDPHPTHLSYPEFDQKNIVSNGGVFEFTFDKVGVWGFHNHVNSSSRGSVTVI